MEARQVAAGNGWQWIVNAFALFKRNPLMWLVLIFIYLVIAVVLSFIPLIGSLAFNLLAPVFVAGLMLGCKALEEGKDLEINHLFEGFKRNTSQLVTVGGIYMVGMIVIVGVVFLVALASGVSASALSDPNAASKLALSAGAAFAILFAALVAILLIVPLIMAYWFAPVLVVFHEMPAVDAMKLSFSACLRNIGACFVCSLIAMVLIIVAMIPFGLGLLLVIPVMILSLYTSYQDIFNISTNTPEVVSL